MNARGIGLATVAGLSVIAVVSLRYARAQNIDTTVTTTPGRIVKWSDVKGALTDSALTESPEGNIGFGTATPAALLEARQVTESYGTSAILGSTFVDSTSYAVPSRIRAGVTGIGLHNYSSSSAWNVGILGYVPPGGHIAGAGAFYAPKWNGTDWTTTARTAKLIGEFQFFVGEIAQSDMSITRSDLAIDFFGNVGIGMTNPTAKLDVAGSIKTTRLEITGGADLSEKFEVSKSQERIKAGMVVAIDPNNPGKLVVSSRAYDRRVAGVISGAGGVHPGMLMSQAGTPADGEHPVALTGRVYCWADASYGSIQPGDLLTTSRTPGHARKATDYRRAQGATIGKAMTPLAQGQGLVLVLVTLQ